MFKLVRRPVFTLDVPVLIPTEEGHEEAVLRTRFRSLVDEDMVCHDLNTLEGLKDFLRVVVIAFENVADEEGRPATMSAELREEIISTPYMRHALVKAYGWAITRGGVAQRQGEATGPAWPGSWERGGGGTRLN